MTGKNVTASNYVQAARKPLKVRDWPDWCGQNIQIGSLKRLDMQNTDRAIKAPLVLVMLKWLHNLGTNDSLSITCLLPSKGQTGVTKCCQRVKWVKKCKSYEYQGINSNQIQNMSKKNIVGLECWCKPDQMIACCVSKVTPTWQIDTLESQRSCRKSVSPTIFEIEHAHTNHFFPYVMRRSDLCGQAPFQKLPLAQQSLGLSSSYSNLDQILSPESRPSVNYKISIKHQHLD